MIIFKYYSIIVSKLTKYRVTDPNSTRRARFARGPTPRSREFPSESTRQELNQPYNSFSPIPPPSVPFGNPMASPDDESAQPPSKRPRRDAEPEVDAAEPSPRVVLNPADCDLGTHPTTPTSHVFSALPFLLRASLIVFSPRRPSRLRCRRGRSPGERASRGRLRLLLVRRARDGGRQGRRAVLLRVQNRR